jgi:ketosteroid isomerase-like protein
MKKINLFVLTIAAAIMIAGCGDSAENKPANTNTSKSTAAAPTVDALFAMDKQANEAWIKGDSKFFEGFISDKFVEYSSGQRMGRDELLKMIGQSKCDVKTWSLDDPQMSKIDADTYVISYKGTFDGTCTGPDGKSMKLPSPIRAASVYIRDGEKWKGAFHGETPIIGAAGTETTGNTAAAEPKKEVAKKEDPKKETPKKDALAMDDSAAAEAVSALAPDKPTAGTNTAGVVKIHTDGWEAWKAKDPEKLIAMTTNDLSIVDPAGNWISGQKPVIKHWTEGMKCEGVTKVSVSDGFASALSPTVELLTLKGTADGTCEGQKNGPLNQTAVYVKVGDAWKLAFMFESPAM